jgi:hypothetical protein
MDPAQDRQVEFIEKYIDYRAKQGRFEQYGKYDADYLDEYGIYYEFLDYLEHDKGTKLFDIKTALVRVNGANSCSWAGLPKSPYTYDIKPNRQDAGKIPSNQSEYCFEIKIKENVDREKLDVILRLHDALKKERNNCNHASDKGKRVPSEYVQKLICCYVNLCVKLLEESDSSKTPVNA